MLTEFTLGFLLALFCAICWAALDISRKRLGAKMTATGATAGLMLLHVVYLGPLLAVGSAVDGGDDVASQILLAGMPELTAYYFMISSVSVVLNLGANFLFLRAVQISPLSLTTPYLAFTPVFSALIALIFLGQIPSTYGWLGIGIVAVGAFFMNPGRDGDGPLRALKALWSERGSFYMLVVALLWGITPALDKTATDLTNPLWHTAFLAASVGVIFVAVAWGRDKSLAPLIAEFRAIPKLLCLAGLFAVGAMLLQLSSYAYIDVAYVETIKRGVGVIGAIAAGYFLFGERDIGRRLLGALVMVIGVAMILMAG